MAVEPRQDLLHGQNQTRPRKGESPSQAAGSGPVWASVLELDVWGIHRSRDGRLQMQWRTGMVDGSEVGAQDAQEQVRLFFHCLP